jgi:U3 small nucleolar RNA-associated protein 19
MSSKEITKKRKSSSKEASGQANPSSKRRAVASDKSKNEQAKIEELEAQISESRKYYNNIATLISMLNANESSEQSPNLAVAVALCRVFCRLIAGGNLQQPPKASEQEKIVVGWLKERLQEYQNALFDIIRHADSSSQVCFLVSAAIVDFTHIECRSLPLPCLCGS